MNYKISQEAGRDIEKIWLYTFENWSLEQADRYFGLIMREIEYLAKHPESGRDFSKFRKGYYCSRVKSHLIFYKINTKKSELEVIRVLHKMMDLASRLEDLG